MVISPTSKRFLLLVGVLALFIVVWASMWAYLFSCEPIDLPGLHFEHCAFCIHDLGSDNAYGFCPVYSYDSNTLFDTLLSKGFDIIYYGEIRDNHRAILGDALIIRGKLGYGLFFDGSHVYLEGVTDVSKGSDYAVSSKILRIANDFLRARGVSIPRNAARVWVWPPAGVNDQECNFVCYPALSESYCFYDDSDAYSLVSDYAENLRANDNHAYCDADRNVYVSLYRSKLPARGSGLRVIGPVVYVPNPRDCSGQDGEDCVSLVCVTRKTCIVSGVEEIKKLLAQSAE